MNSAKLIGTTEPIGLGLFPEEFIVYMARVSNPENQDKTTTGEKLLRYLVVHGHWSPFDMINVIMDITTSRAVMAQILRHWSFRFQEFSQRYAEVKDLDFSGIELRKKSKGSDRQSSDDEVLTSESAEAKNFCDYGAVPVYHQFIRQGVSKETARLILPLATPTHAYMAGSVRSWMTYFWQRLDVHAQKEHRELALLMFKEFQTKFPLCADLVNSGRPSFVFAPVSETNPPTPK